LTISLDAEARIGELLKDTSKQGKTKQYGSTGGTIPTLPSGINKKQSHIFQTLADHKDIIEQVKAEAVENDDLPTRTEVLRKVKEKEKDKRMDNERKGREKDSTGSCRN
jgi:hypothetical protein